MQLKLNLGRMFGRRRLPVSNSMGNLGNAIKGQERLASGFTSARKMPTTLTQKRTTGTLAAAGNKMAGVGTKLNNAKTRFQTGQLGKPKSFGGAIAPKPKLGQRIKNFATRAKTGQVGKPQTFGQRFMK